MVEYMFEYVVASRSTPEAVALLDRAREAAGPRRGRRGPAGGGCRVVGVALPGDGGAGGLGRRCLGGGGRAGGAALGCSVAMGHSYLRYAMAMRERLPQVGAVFAAGGIDYRAFQTLVFRTDLITDAQVLARVDATLAVLVSRRPSLTRGGLAAAVDRVVAAVDADAVRGHATR
ncbi:hypothetical protein I549_2725 [Mycobacterium avium subsp. avium 2285 (R)]|nr:hypothetical protein I549_2725 [Mycobacterium avium subsp. avium 2285 (R)]